jgi:maltose/moltooligosaccharide transporter
MTTRPRAGFWQIWNMCFGFVGIQFAFALQNSNMSRIFQTLGAGVDDIPVLWIAAPLTGLIVQPIVGHCSDRTWSRFGRRRPSFLGGALLAAIALFVMPDSPALWVAALLLWLLDGSINVSMGPFRSFVGDQLPADQRALGYAMQTFFIAAGSVVASLAPWLFARFGVANTAAAGVLPDTVRYSFEIGACVLLFAMGWSVLTTREYAPAALDAFDDATPAADDPPMEGGTRRRALLWVAAGGVALAAMFWLRSDRQLRLLGGGMIAYGFVLWIASTGRRDNAFTHIVADLHAMPETMRRLVPVQFFSWFALFAMWIYTTAAVTQVQFGTTDPSSSRYNEGANWVGVLFAAYNAFAIVAAALIPPMTRRFGLRASHVFNLALGGCGLASFLVVRDPRWLVLSMAGVGFAWASILSLPYALLANSVPTRKMGVYMGIFNLSIVVPQLFAASILAFLLRSLFANAAIDALLIGGVGLLLAGACMLRVPEPAPR